MVVLITGPTHVGKTRLAQLLMEKRGIPYFSEDHLKMGLIRSGKTALTPQDDREMTEYLWPIVREMIRTVIENYQNLIVEGCYIPFDWKKDFSEEELREIRFLCLCMSDSYIDEQYGEIMRNARCIEARLDDADCTAEYLKQENRFYREGCEAYGLDVALIEGNYVETVGRLLNEKRELWPEGFEPVLETERLILRKWRESDAESLYEYAKDPDVGPMAGWPPHESVEGSLYAIRNFLNGPECYCICEKGTDRAIGAVELILPPTEGRVDECELGFWLGKPFWGRGYMPEAARALLRRAFVTLGMETVRCCHFVENVQSKRVQEKLGFVFGETVKTEALGELRTHVVNRMTKEQYRALYGED